MILNLYKFLFRIVSFLGLYGLLRKTYFYQKIHLLIIKKAIKLSGSDFKNSYASYTKLNDTGKQSINVGKSAVINNMKTVDIGIFNGITDYFGKIVSENAGLPFMGNYENLGKTKIGIVIGMSPLIYKFIEQNFKHKKIIAWWIGTDVLHSIIYRLDFSKVNIKHICVHERLQTELKTINVDSKVVPLIADKIADIPFPEKPGVLLYIPDEREVFFNLNVLLNIIRKNPDIDFYVYGRKKAIKGFSNLYNVGMIYGNDKIELYKKISLYIRIPFHDGLPNSMIEMLTNGRRVIHNYPYSYVDFLCSNMDDLNSMVNKLYNKSLEKEALEYYRSNYNITVMHKSLNKILDVYR